MNGAADERAAARDRAADGWRHLAAFGREGARHLPAAINALREAERIQRRTEASDDLTTTLMGLSLALRLLRDPGEARRAVVLAQELVNTARRARGDPDALPYRSYLEAAYRDLADIETSEAALRAAEQGLDACDRTLGLARRLRVPRVVPSSQATKGALLLRLAVLRGAAGTGKLRRDAERLYLAALNAWPAQDAEGRAVVELELAEAYAARGGAPGRAELLVRSAAGVLDATENRYLRARAARARAALALAADRPDALDQLEAAAAAFRALGCEWEAREVEALL